MQQSLAPQLDELVWYLHGRAVVALTGAGMSTDSGIPDYRGPRGRLKTRTPVTLSEFLRSPEDRRRYWARSCLGWPFMAQREPNEAHRALAGMQRAGSVGRVITQNVDGLHQSAGSEPVLELHGGLSRVICLDCAAVLGRDRYQRMMLAANPGWMEQTAEIAPDGDAELSRRLTQLFKVPPCPVCGGTLKPDVIFFGENVPTPRVDEAFSYVERADALLVLGSSLTVYSGFRFADRAARQGKTLAIVNGGPTRADDIATIKLDAPLTPTLSQLAERLNG